ncbi:outer membrane protein assembly factor BamB [Hahella aquimaris]|uniref:outer membrane protein assembly factor BamB n=1 Tax=Hahella sp. HNIBRBA332 TaxID=3015983 RepID=UPI00273C5A46|nr:outer membrane protein assembly factor BamB [Hahella sp. HNIBRBA332]WLQ17286.1 outer membrane protein assembly factor BamB [Hahella sp. HNIBRBA332]
MKFRIQWRPLGALFFVMAGLLSGCGSDDVRPDPAELKSFTPEIELKRLWSRSIGDGQDEQFLKFAPFVVDDKIYANDVDGEVYAMELESGKRLWDIDLDEPLVGGVGGDYRRVFVATLDGELLALNRENGEILWRAPTSSEVLAPAVSGSGKAIVQTLDGKLAAYDVEDGKKLWEFASNEPALTLRGTAKPVLLQDGVISGMANGSVVAVSVNDGQLYWEQRVATPKGRTELERLVDIDGDVLVQDGALFAVSYQGQLSRLSPMNGKEEWSMPMSSYVTPGIGFTNIYVSTTEGDVVAIDRNSKKEIWRQSDLSYRELSSPVVWGNYLAVGDLEGYVHILSQVDGRMLARIHLAGEPIHAAPLIYGNHLIILGSDGDLSVWDIK